jgi:flagellar hook-associated protein 2
VTAYNQAITASRPDTSSEASSTLASSRRALTNASADTSRSQLAKLGLSRQADGTLKLDTAALNKALTAGASTGTAATGGTGLSTLAQLGKAIGKRADNELASSSRLATATSLFSGKTTQLKQQQTRLLEAATQMSSQANTSTGTNTSNWSTQQALRKYSV